MGTWATRRTAGRDRVTTRAEELLDQLHEEIAATRIAVAWKRDCMLNEGELTAMLEVYVEFGR